MGISVDCDEVPPLIILDSIPLETISLSLSLLVLGEVIYNKIENKENSEEIKNGYERILEW